MNDDQDSLGRSPGPFAAFFKAVREGLSYVFSHKIIVAMMDIEAASYVFRLDQAMLTIFARDVLRVGASGLGFSNQAAAWEACWDRRS